MKTNKRIAASLSLLLIGFASAVAYAAPKTMSNAPVRYMCSSNNEPVSATYIYQNDTPMHVVLKVGNKNIYLNRNMDVAMNESGYRFTEALGYEWTTDAFNKASVNHVNARALRYGNDVLVSGCANVKNM